MSEPSWTHIVAVGTLLAMLVLLLWEHSGLGED